MQHLAKYCENFRFSLYFATANGKFETNYDGKKHSLPWRHDNLPSGRNGSGDTGTQRRHFDKIFTIPRWWALTNI